MQPTRTALSSDWFMKAPAGMLGWPEDEASGLLRSAKGWMVFHDCRY